MLDARMIDVGFKELENSEVIDQRFTEAVDGASMEYCALKCPRRFQLSKQLTPQSLTARI